MSLVSAGDPYDVRQLREDNDDDQCYDDFNDRRLLDAGRPLSFRTTTGGFSSNNKLSSSRNLREHPALRGLQDEYDSPKFVTRGFFDGSNKNRNLQNKPGGHDDDGGVSAREFSRSFSKKENTRGFYDCDDEDHEEPTSTRGFYRVPTETTRGMNKENNNRILATSSENAGGMPCLPARALMTLEALKGRNAQGDYKLEAPDGSSLGFLRESHLPEVRRLAKQPSCGECDECLGSV